MCSSPKDLRQTSQQFVGFKFLGLTVTDVPLQITVFLFSGRRSLTKQLQVSVPLHGQDAPLLPSGCPLCDADAELRWTSDLICLRGLLVYYYEPCFLGMELPYA